MELMEKVDVDAANKEDLVKDDLCPFCHKKPIGHAKDNPKKVDDKVTSIPDDLGCDTSSWREGKSDKRTDGDLPYTLAKHHLISAMQCYAKIRRLVRMGNMVGYDINNKNNGIGLPTTHWSLKYPADGKPKKYGDLDDPDGKKKVAFALMKELGGQWHVGHHAFDVVVSKKDVDSWLEGGAAEKEKNDYPHETSYDKLIIHSLFALVKSFPNHFCEEPKLDEKFKQDMDDISAEIKGKLEKFNGKGGANPTESSPFFVSIRAYEYSGIAENLPNADMKPNTVSRGRS